MCFSAFITKKAIYCNISICCHENNLRILRGSKQQKIKNIEAQKKIRYSYKKKRVYVINYEIKDDIGPMYTAAKVSI